MAFSRINFLSVTIFSLLSSVLAQRALVTSGEAKNCDHGVLDNFVIEPKDGALWMKFKILKEMSDNCEMAVVITASGQTMFDDVIAFCDCFDDEMIGKDCVAHGKEENFPKACPTGTGEFSIEDFRVSEDKTRGFAEGPLEVYVKFICDGEVCCELTINGEIKYE